MQWQQPSKPPLQPQSTFLAMSFVGSSVSCYATPIAQHSHAISKKYSPSSSTPMATVGNKNITLGLLRMYTSLSKFGNLHAKPLCSTNNRRSGNTVLDPHVVFVCLLAAKGLAALLATPFPIALWPLPWRIVIASNVNAKAPQRVISSIFAHHRSLVCASWRRITTCSGRPLCGD